MEVEPVEPVESDACVDDVSKNLNMDFERAATSQQISATSQPAVSCPYYAMNWINQPVN
jgi:hypothetical protein